MHPNGCVWDFKLAVSTGAGKSYLTVLQTEICAQQVAMKLYASLPTTLLVRQLQV